MIYNSALKYSVDTRLMMALMELDSRFGTQGLGARTNNPGNVGNNGIDERTYSSWEAGVDAVANWLNNHRLTPVSENNTESVTMPQNSIDYTTTPASSPVQTVENIVISPDVASGITSATTSIPVIDTSTTTEPVIDTSTTTTQ
jgi:hypothetical protein